jgi:hypothetical protein
METSDMSTVSQRIHALRQKFAQFEHGGHCFGSEEMMALGRELRGIAAAAEQLEARKDVPLPGFPPRPAPSQPPQPQPGAIAVGTFFFVPAEARQ